MKKILICVLLLTITNVCINANASYLSGSVKLSLSEIAKFKGDLNSSDDIKRSTALMALSEAYKEDTKFWIEQTKNKYPDVRCSALRMLWETKGNEAIAYAKSALNDKDDSVVITAVEILGKSKDPSILPLLIEKTNNNNPDVRATAVLAFKNFPPTEDLINVTSDILLKDNNSRVRWATVFYLREIRVDKYRTLIQAAFIKAVKKEMETDLKCELIKCIGITDAQILDLIASFLTDKDIAAKLTVIEKLGYVPTEFKDKSIDLLAPLFKDSDPRIRAAAVKACAYLDTKKSSPYIIEALNDKDDNVRLAALKFFERHMSDKSAEPALIEMLKDGNRTVRLQAVITLKDFTTGGGSTGRPVQVVDPQITDALLDMLDREKDRYIIEKILMDFAAFNEKRATSKIVMFLKDEDDGVRDTAVRALGEIKDETSVTALAEITKDKNPNIAKRAIEALGDIGGKSAMPVIERGMEDNKIKDTSIVELLRMQSPKAEEYILDLLKSNDDAQRLGALDTLNKAVSDLFSVKEPERIIVGLLGQDQIRHALFYLTNDKNIEIRRKAFSLVLCLGGYVDIGMQSKSLNSFRETLTQELIPVILKGLNDSDEEVQIFALKVCLINSLDRNDPRYWKRRLYTSEISKALESRLNSPNQKIRKMADEVIKSMNNDKSNSSDIF